MTIAFRRTRFTWLAYFMLGYFAYIEAAFGPLIPFLRDELNLNYTLSGMHFSAFALGLVLSGFITDRIAAILGRPKTFWVGALGMALASFLLLAFRHVVLTISASFLIGLIGSWLLVMIQSTLSDEHGANRAVALTESNIMASVAAGLVPAITGWGAGTVIGWRAGLWAGILMALLITVIYARTPFPAPTPADEDEPTAGNGKPLPLAFWAYWASLIFNIAIEWCIILWSAGFLEEVIGFEKEAAAASVSIIFVAMVIGRTVGSRMTRRYLPSVILPYALGIVALGFPLLWLGTSHIIALVGLFIVGLGIANFYPLTLAAAINIAPQQADRISARMTLGAGVAILFAPQILGTLADALGLHTAFMTVIVLVLASAITLWLGHRLRKRKGV